MPLVCLKIHLGDFKVDHLFFSILQNLERIADRDPPPTGASQLLRKVLWRLEALAPPPMHHLIGLFRWLGPGIAG